MASTYEDYLQGQTKARIVRNQDIFDTMNTAYDDYLAESERISKAADEGKRQVGLQMRRGKPITLPDHTSQAWQGLPMPDTDASRERLAQWEKNRVIPREDLTIPMQDEDKLQRLKYAYGEDELRDWVDRANAYDADLVQGRKESAGRATQNLLSSFTGGPARYSHPLKEMPEQKKPAGTWNPLVHMGKDAMAISSGMRQLFGEDDNKYSKDFQKSLDVYNQRDQPLGAQLVADALYMIPSMGASPLIVKGAEKGLSSLVKSLGASKVGADLAKTPLSKAIAANKSIRLPPGLGGMIEGGVVGGLYHVNPESNDAWKTRLSRAIVGGSAGGLLDAGATAVSRIANSARTAKARADASKGLPESVRLPSAELWNQRDLARTAMQNREAGARPSIDWKQQTKDLYESGYGAAAEDISRNANKIREQATGSVKPKMTGEALEPMLTRLKSTYALDKDAAFDSVNKYIDSGAVVSLDSSVIRGAKNELSQDISRQFGGIKTPERIKNFLKTVKAMEKRAGKTGGISRAKDLMKLLRTTDTLIRGGDTILEATASRFKRNLVESLQQAEAKGHVVGGSVNDIASFNKANNAISDFYLKYKNPIIEKTAQNDYTPREFADSLFGTKRIRDKATRLDAIKRLATNPARERALRSELLNKLMERPDSKDFDMQAFFKTYGPAGDKGGANKLINRLLPKQRSQLDALYNMSDRMINTQTKGNVEGLTRTSSPIQGLAKELWGTGGSPLNLPGIKQLGGEDILKYLQARRYSLGYEHPMGTLRNTGKTGALMSLDTWDPGEKLDEDRR